MLLSQKTSLVLSDSYLNIIGHMCYAASKLWNVCNYERYHYKELNLEQYPDWYYQKKVHKDNVWYKQLPSQTAQEVCKQLDKSWKSFYELKKTQGIQNPRPPRFKLDNVAITYMQNGIVHESGSEKVRLSLPKKLMEYMAANYDIHEKFLFLENKFFKNMEHIKQIKIYPPEKGRCNIIVIYEIDDVEMLSDNNRYLSIDIGLHNLMTCYNSISGETFIVGRKYLTICNYYHKEIARVQSQWYAIQSKKGIQYPKTSVHIRQLYARKQNAILDYLHKITRYIVDYCKKHNIHTVVIGDIKNIRQDKSFGHVTNQKIHSLPYAKIYQKLDYKLLQTGIRMIRQKEAYSSQTSPLADQVSKKHAQKSNRVQRGLYKDQGNSWNADCVGAFNILRLYLQKTKSAISLNPLEIQEPYVVKVAV